MLHLSNNSLSFSQLASLVILALMGTSFTDAATSTKLSITAASYSSKTNTLVVKTGVKGISGDLTLLHGDGGLLNTQTITSAKQTFSIPLAQLGQVPCTIEARAGGLSTIKTVSGAPVDCAKVPVCKIVSPLPGKLPFYVKAGEPVNFEGKVILKDKKSGPATIEWDFAGGAMGHPKTSKTTATFIRNDANYRVRFTAYDAKKRFCEASVNIAVGSPPNNLPAKVSELSAPKRGEEVAGVVNDIAVLPFQEWSMQHEGDMKSVKNGYMTFVPLVNNLRAYAYKKALKPIALNDQDVELRYSAASNPFDPVGAGSINSTSQNWPLNSMSMDMATIQKTDIWDTFSGRAESEKASGYSSTSWIMDRYKSGGAPEKDEGTFKYKATDGGGSMGHDHGSVPDNDPNNNDHGRYMPGKTAPYQVNEPQPFSKFVAQNYAKETANWFTANLIPKTDIDDTGRVNPYSVMRVEAVQKNTNTLLAKTDAVLSSGRDMHCRECHAKGGIAAPTNPPHTKAACRAGAYGKVADTYPGRNDFFYPPCVDTPTYYTTAEAGGDPNNLFDQEYAAALNYSSIHEFYDGIFFLTYMQQGSVDIDYFIRDADGNPDFTKPNPNLKKTLSDGPANCDGCHFSALNNDVYGNSWYDGGRNDVKDPAYFAGYSVSMHRFHGELQWNADKSGIQRDERGVFVRYDWAKGTASPNRNPKTLFPVFGEDGKQLPMEENCLKCHGGQREQHYRDRMYTAGVTCYDCHGDMLGVGGAFTKTGKPGLAVAGDPGDPEDAQEGSFRVPWFDETDCGSCHTGKGKDAVLKTAFDSTDPAQMSRKVDLTKPDAARFAVVPLYKRDIKVSATGRYYPTESFPQFEQVINLKATVFREGKDTHGNVACAACHGAAHAIWPNRDPKANDNLTAIQLQGHVGTILECNVCHDKDSFKDLVNLDGGTYSGDSKTGILGGPHNMHPVNDPYWWKEAPADTVDSTPDSPKRKNNVIKGGWHNDYAKIGGKSNEDQCAACHGADHKGTRLSKTPVDRDFINEKGKKVSVKAGSSIACDLCHTLDKSFTGSPSKTI